MRAVNAFQPLICLHFTSMITQLLLLLLLLLVYSTTFHIYSGECTKVRRTKHHVLHQHQHRLSCRHSRFDSLEVLKGVVPVTGSDRRPVTRAMSAESGSSSEMTLSGYMLACCRAFACPPVRGQPSKSQPPLTNSGVASAVQRLLHKVDDQGVGNKLASVHVSPGFLAEGQSGFDCSAQQIRRGVFNSSMILSHWLPFPEAGAPDMIRR